MHYLAEKPFEGYKLYIVFHKKEKRNYACLVSREHRMTISYARYRMSVMEGRILEKWEKVDHKDDNKQNDSDDNLQILTHLENCRKSAKGRTMVKLICPSCGVEFERERRLTHLIKGGTNTFCSRTCNGRTSMRKQYV